jgi:hypothetical protein
MRVMSISCCRINYTYHCENPACSAPPRIQSESGCVLKVALPANPEDRTFPTSNLVCDKLRPGRSDVSVGQDLSVKYSRSSMLVVNLTTAMHIVSIVWHYRLCGAAAAAG